jgi:hypothetical protein
VYIVQTQCIPTLEYIIPSLLLSYNPQTKEFSHINPPSANTTNSQTAKNPNFHVIMPGISRTRTKIPTYKALAYALRDPLDTAWYLYDRCAKYIIYNIRLEALYKKAYADNASVKDWDADAILVIKYDEPCIATLDWRREILVEREAERKRGE